MQSISSFNIQRYPKTENKSLLAGNAADEYLFSYTRNLEGFKGNLTLVNDRFGFLACHLNEFNPQLVIDCKSQAKSIQSNLQSNNLEVDFKRFISPLDNFLVKADLVLMKIPKSLNLYNLYLEQISRNADENTVVICGLMTKYFNVQLLKIAEEYFTDVSQSLAHKKSRLLILKGKKPTVTKPIVLEVKLDEEKSIQQYYGVFSSNNIDYATQFLLEKITLQEQDQKVLDLASGNGIIAFTIQNYYASKNWQTPELHLVDDSFLAIESSKLNLEGENVHFHNEDNLMHLEADSFDLIVTNPPFHFEYEINLEISLSLLEQAHRCLKSGGRLIVVSNRHLNYKSHLVKYFSTVNLVAENSKFVIIEGVKG